MNRIFLIVLFLVPHILFSQSINTAGFVPMQIKQFGLYLFQQKDYLRAAMELERYLYMISQPDDTVEFLIGLSHQLRGAHQYAVQEFRKIAERDSSSLCHTARLALFYNLSQLEDWETIKHLNHRDDCEFFYYYLAEIKSNSDPKDPEWFSAVNDSQLREQLIELEAARQKLNSKSPILAATFSGIIPGSGKFYIKRSGDALFSFGMINLFGLVAFKAFEANLVVTGVITSGLSLSLYLGTIYGSYIGAQIYNQHLYDDWQKQLENLDPILKNPYWKLWVKE